MFAELQCVRRTAGLPTFTGSASIALVANAWSWVMANGTGLNHNPYLTYMLTKVDPRWMDAGEVVGVTTAGTGQVSRIVASWLRSDEHRAELLDPHLRIIGIGMCYGAGQLWTTVDLVDR
jgi:uncharacterized protein YkwD